ncbi:MAG TPA: DUF4012 domain-containing protein [Chloroflexota bacterium]|jgi:LPXTG-site transpeptidase (sortase) family protein|nr:DUF4012 domain-containing protein [Chloroflexota bacterium]
MLRQRSKIVALGVLCVAAVVLLVGTLWLRSLEARGKEAQQHLVDARAALSGGLAGALLEPSQNAITTDTAPSQLADACTEAGRADSLLTDISGQMRAVMPAVQALGRVPGVGERTRTQAVALAAATDLAAAGAALCRGAQQVIDAAGGESGSATTGAIQALVGTRPYLSEAVQRLDGSLAAINTLPAGELDASTTAGLEALRLRLPALIDSLRDTVALLDVLGAPGEHHFLLLSQNPDELRATGGYIGSAGVIALDNGTVRLLEYGSSRRYDTPADERAPTPRPFNTYLGEYWQFAGANWWANFPDVARQLSYFYSLSRPDSTIDGVIALDQFGLQRLLEALGPVDVPDYGERIAAEDLQAALDRHVHAGDGNDELGRKQFTAALSTAVLQQLLKAPRPLLPALAGATRNALEQQHLLISVSDPTVSAVLAKRHWDGAVLPVAGDGLMVIDTDVVASKQSQAVRRDVAYAVNLAPGDGASSDGPQATTTITYTNNSHPNPLVTYLTAYRTFVRVYAPGGATLTDTNGFSGPIMTDQECGRAVFGGEVEIPEASTTQVTLKYRLPSRVEDQQGYDLLVQQQPGVPAGHIAVTVTRGAVTSQSQGENVPGRQFHWRLARTSDAVLSETPPPQSGGSTCSRPLVEASPIAPPVWLDVPSAKISTPIVDLGVGADGIMEAPPTPDVVGWYRMSARAGQPGNSVLAGHVDWGQNTAVFWGLRNLEPSDAIVVHGTDGVLHHYVVQWNRVFSRTDAAATEFVRGSDQPLLTLITCDGVYDRSLRDYSDRRIVRAVLGE